jgi:hypothetical protein
VVGGVLGGVVGGVPAGGGSDEPILVVGDVRLSWW